MAAATARHASSPRGCYYRSSSQESSNLCQRTWLLLSRRRLPSRARGSRSTSPRQTWSSVRRARRIQAAPPLLLSIPPPWDFYHNAGGSPLGSNWLWIPQPPAYWIECGSIEPNAAWPPRCAETRHVGEFRTLRSLRHLLRPSWEQQKRKLVPRRLSKSSLALDWHDDLALPKAQSDAPRAPSSPGGSAH